MNQRTYTEEERKGHVYEEIAYLRAIAAYIEDQELNNSRNAVPYPKTDDAHVKETVAATVYMYTLPRENFITWCIARGLINRPEELY
jgi:hypothetical protein